MRCFAAIELDDAIKGQLLRVQALFRGLPGKLTWPGRNQMHLTVKFLGEVPDVRIEQVKETLQRVAAQVAPFGLRASGLGAFPPGGRRLSVLWVGVSAPDELRRLHRLCEDGFAALGFEPEARDFSPHLTIARVKETPRPEDYRKIIDRHKDFVAGTQRCERIILFASTLTPAGPIYQVLTEAPFTG